MYRCPTCPAPRNCAKCELPKPESSEDIIGLSGPIWDMGDDEARTLGYELPANATGYTLHDCLRAVAGPRWLKPPVDRIQMEVL